MKDTLKKIFKNKWTYIILAIIIVVILIILWLRQYKCSKGSYPWQSPILTGMPYPKCSFWTGKPIALNSQRAQAGGCCKDADGRNCYPCLSVACCSAGFKAGYRKNRDLLQTSVA